MASPPPEDLVELDTDVQASDQVTLSDEDQDEADQDESNQVAVGARGRGMGRSGKGGKGGAGGGTFGEVVKRAPLGLGPPVLGAKSAPSR